MNTYPTRSPINFTMSQVLQVLALIVAGLLAWGDLKTELRVLYAQVNLQTAQQAKTLDNHETRIVRLERAHNRVSENEP